MGGRGAKSSSNSREEIHKNEVANRIMSKADSKGKVAFQLEGNGTLFRIVKNDNNTYTIKARNRIYGKNVSANEAKRIIQDTQERFNKMNESFKKMRI